MLPEDLSTFTERRLSDKYGHDIKILNASSLSGGSINEAFRLVTDEGDFFIKFNYASRYPGMFEKEAAGLEILGNADEIDVPEVIDYGENGPYSFIILNYIEPAAMKDDFWRGFGTGLAALHKHSSEHFGLDHDNYIGSLPQSNHKHEEWVSFFIEERLNPQIRMARDNNLISPSMTGQFEDLFRLLPGIIPVENPSLIHGDLWSGNYMTGSEGQAVIIDPAVYFGHREMDIGMSRLFGGFGNEFYVSYNDAWPMVKGWQERTEICNLYPLMVHVNLFGSGYVGSVKGILDRYT